MLVRDKVSDHSVSNAQVRCGFFNFVLSSVVFWTSGLVKESIAMAALCFLIMFFVKIYCSVRLQWWEWVLLPIALWLLWNLKYYYVAVLLPVAVTAIVMKRVVAPFLKIKSIVLYVIIWLVVFAVPLLVVSRIHPNFYPEYFLEVIAGSYAQICRKIRPG